MNQRRWKIGLSFSLIVLSAVLYSLHFAVFKDSHHIFLYLLGDIAFLPIDVLIVTLILDRLLSFQEKRSIIHKLNMVIGAFYSEVGRQLLSSLSGFNANIQPLRQQLLIRKEWQGREFAFVLKKLSHANYALESSLGDLQGLKEFLLGKREFLLRLLENPNLLEHESFTNLLWSVFHLTEELSQRQKVTGLGKPDYEHLSGDMQRAYKLLVLEWVRYMSHLHRDYPYLFSLALRTNPFDPQATVEVR